LISSQSKEASAEDAALKPTAPADKLLALFVSDVHLHASGPKTAEAFFSFLHRYAIHAERLYLLGDLFEYWAGDDDLQTPFNQRVASELRRVTDAGVTVFWIAGNRDFLVGEKFASYAKLSLLPDPFITRIGMHDLVLTHGDALCTDDVSYMAFRAQVRDRVWQDAFLSKPLAERKSIIEGMRSGSREAQRMKAADIMDTNAQAVAELFRSTKAAAMIHGHTHRPAKHMTRTGDRPLTRYVLPDWDCDAAVPRGGWIAIDRSGTIRRHDLEGKELL
jgi:UDP-2,3-diacylglucosamine hydrolase